MPCILGSFPLNFESLKMIRNLNVRSYKFKDKIGLPRKFLIRRSSFYFYSEQDIRKIKIMRRVESTGSLGGLNGVSFGCDGKISILPF